MRNSSYSSQGQITIGHVCEICLPVDYGTVAKQRLHV